MGLCVALILIGARLTYLLQKAKLATFALLQPCPVQNRQSLMGVRTTGSLSPARQEAHRENMVLSIDIEFAQV